MNALLKPVMRIQFDDLETKVQSKYTPVAVSLAVVEGTRWILGFEVSDMPYKKKLTGKKLIKYGGHKDQRAQGRDKLFSRIRPLCRPDVVISSDQQPHYPRSIKKHFPQATHVQHESRRPRDHGQDELKKGFDPLFSLNHTCAVKRDRMARLARKSWCMSKTRQGLRWHLAIHTVAHNKRLEIWRELQAGD